MNQIIKPESIDFNTLISSNTTLTINGQSNMINTLKQEFTEEELRWFVANLLAYTMYHPTNDFPINLDVLVKLVDFANKQNAKRTLVNNFIENVDYKIQLIPKDGQVKTNGGAGLNKEKVMMNIDTFKNMCMLVKTEKSKEIRRYYVKLENIYNKIVKEEIENTRMLLQEKDKQLLITQTSIKQLENRIQVEPKINKHKLLLDKFNGKRTLYVAEVSDSCNEIKLGSSNDIHERCNDHIRTYGKCIFLDIFECDNFREIERFILQDTLIEQNKYTQAEPKGSCSLRSQYLPNIFSIII